MDNYLECFECGGTGYVDSTYPVCFKPASECCGGCYENVECEYCDGCGDIYALDEMMDDEIMMVKAYENMLINMKTLKHELKMISNECNEDAEATMKLLLNPKYTNDVTELINHMNRIEMHKEILINNIKEAIERHNGN